MISKPSFSASRSQGMLAGRTMSAFMAVGFMLMSTCTWKSRACSASRLRAVSACETSRFDPKLTSVRTG
ncbi:Uncharacterised protein [Bordetella pertussis]|nr:Uncharacterised protein [Bordetella pertussis]CFT89788.1 Uncharacterised protein [Bordetella pertussis]